MARTLASLFRRSTAACIKVVIEYQEQNVGSLNTYLTFYYSIELFPFSQNSKQEAFLIIT